MRPRPFDDARGRLAASRDMVVIGLAILVLFGLSIAFDVFDNAELYLMEGGHLDEALGFALLLLMGLAIFSVRRTAQAARERSLRHDTEHQFRTVIEQAPATTYTSDARKHAGQAPILYMSPQVEKLLGFPAADWLRDPGLWLRCIHPNDRKWVVDESDRADVSGETFRVEYRGIRKDGHVVWIQDESNIVSWDPDGRPLIAQGVMWDITARKEAELALRDAEGRYRLLVEQLPVAIYTDAVDELSTAIYISPQYERITGYSPEERMARPNLWVEMLHPDDRAYALAESERTNATREPFDLDYRIVHADGHTVWLHDYATLVTGPVGEPIWQGVLTDITARKEAEEELARRDRILEAATFAAERFLQVTDWAEAIPDVMCRLGLAVDASRAYVYRNEDDATDGLVMSLVDEWTSPGVVGSREFAFNHRWPYESGYRRWTESLGAGTTIHGLVRDLPPEERGEAEAEGTLSLCVVPVFVEGSWWGFIGFDRCDEERTWYQAEIDWLRVVANTLGAAIHRHAAAAKLVEAEERFRAIVEHIPAAIYVDAPNTRLDSLYVSPQIEEITGITPEQWVASPNAWTNAIHPDDREEIVRDYVAAIDAEHPWAAEYRMVTVDGRTIWVHDETTLLRDAAGTPLLLQGVISDITERKLAEEALRGSERKEREAAARLRALDEMKNTFLAAVSHELRSPLTSILGLSLTLERGAGMSNDDRADLTARLGANARKLDRLLKDLLDVDRLSRGIVEPQYRMTDIGVLTRRTAESLESLAGRDVHVAAESVQIEIDPPKVERILENLLSNAAKHASDATIWVRVHRMGDGVSIVVEDSGRGVPVDLREAIFEPFRQGPATPTHAPGTGIGLSLVASFARLHGGRAWVEERAGGGASFRVWLPGRRADRSRSAIEPQDSMRATASAGLSSPST